MSDALLADLLAGVILVALVGYALLGGADYGGGVWDMLARGPRKEAQRTLIADAIGPVWEANHVWLILVVVLLFTAFPPAFAMLTTVLHIPLTLMLVGIVLRGSAFVFRQYGAPEAGHRWGVVFAVSSLLTPACLGFVLGALSIGPTWWAPYPLAVGILATSTFAMLAASYLAVELAASDDEQAALLRGDFRRRFAIAAVMTAMSAAAAAVLAPPVFARSLLAPVRAVPVIGGFGVSLTLAFVASRRRHDRLARAAAIVAVALLVLGWGIAQYPVVVAPDLTLESAAAPRITLQLLVPVIVVGAVILVPSLWWLMRVFKSGKPSRETGSAGSENPRDEGH